MVRVLKSLFQPCRGGQRCLLLEGKPDQSEKAASWEGAAGMEAPAWPDVKNTNHLRSRKKRFDS